MIRLLPFILIPILAIAGLGYWRYNASKPSLESPKTTADDGPIEVPKTLPGSSIEDRIKVLEDSIISVVNKLNVPSSTPTADSSLDSRLKSAEVTVTELKARVSSLENATPVSAVSSSQKAPLYIPLGSGGQTSDTNWANLNTFQISLDPASYDGYSSMQLEVNMRLNQPGGQVYARLYNSSSGSATSSEMLSTSTTSSVATSSTFTLPSGSKNYVLQAKSKDGSQVFIDYARIRVNY